MVRVEVVVLVVMVVVSEVTVARRPPWKSCADVVENFMPCMGFVEGILPEPGRECCEGVKRLNKIAKRNKDTDQRVCVCIEMMANADHPPLLGANVRALPWLCQTHLSFPISVAMDCSRI